MAPKYELCYFPQSGRAGIARIMFRIAGVEFTNTTYSREEWAKVKSDVKRFPLHRMPVLHVDDRVIFESSSVYRFIAEELGFNGENSLERAKINTIVSLVTDIWIEFTKFVIESDEKKRTEGYKNMFQTVVKTVFTCLEGLLKQQDDGKGYFLSKLSWADVAFLDINLVLQTLDSSHLDPYPLLKALQERLCAIEAVVKYRKDLIVPKFF